MKISTLAQPQLAQEKVNRMLYLDGLRGVAILMVVLFHIFSRWPDFLPYLTQYGDFFFLNLVSTAFNCSLLSQDLSFQ